MWLRDAKKTIVLQVGDDNVDQMISVDVEKSK